MVHTNEPMDRWNDITIESGAIIHVGTMSTVFEGKWKHTDVDIKVIRGTSKEAVLPSFEKEFELLVQLRYPRIALLMAVCTGMRWTCSFDHGILFQKIFISLSKDRANCIN
jgi:hypothetical protein